MYVFWIANSWRQGRQASFFNPCSEICVPSNCNSCKLPHFESTPIWSSPTFDRVRPRTSSFESCEIGSMFWMEACINSSLFKERIWQISCSDLSVTFFSCSRNEENLGQARSSEKPVNVTPVFERDNLSSFESLLRSSQGFRSLTSLIVSLFKLEKFSSIEQSSVLPGDFCTTTSITLPFESCSQNELYFPRS